MRLITFTHDNRTRIGAMRETGQVLDLTAADPELPATMIDLSREPKAMERARNAAESAPEIELADVRLEAPVPRPSKVLAIGLNYRDHAEETGAPIPEEPILFMKSTTSIIGPNDDVVLPRGSLKGDWEVELGVVIGTRASYVDEADALEHVAGYCVFNDVSERHFQLEGTGQWVKGKSADTFAPFGPYMVTRDEVPDPQDLHLWLEVDGKRYQDGSTRTMIFSVAHLVSYVSRYMTLVPGDIIPTGTPPGVGLGMKPPVFLKPGNVMRVGIDGLGEQEQRVVAHPDG